MLGYRFSWECKGASRVCWLSLMLHPHASSPSAFFKVRGLDRSTADVVNMKPSGWGRAVRCRADKRIKPNI